MREPSVSRRTFLGLFAAGAGSLALAGCGVVTAPAASTQPAESAASNAKPAASNPATTSGVAPTATASAAAKPASGQSKSGGTLRAGIVGDLPSIDGQQSLPGINATVGNAYEQLTRYGENLTP